MRQSVLALFMLATFSGCMSVEKGGGPPTCNGMSGPSRGPTVPGVQGAWGTPVSMAQPYASAPPSPHTAMAMMRNNIPLDMVQMHQAQMGSGVMQAGATGPGQSGLTQAQFQGGPGGPAGATPPPFMVPPGGMLSPPGMPFAPGLPRSPMMPMGGGMPNPGIMPTAGNTPGPAQGPIVPGAVPYNARIPGAVAAVGVGGANQQLRFSTKRTQVRFMRPSGMRISWFVGGENGQGGYSQNSIEAPGKYNFVQAAVYRLKLSNILKYPGMELYPTLEVVPANPRTEAFLAHSAVPISFTDDDFRQVASGNYVVKVIYLPDPRFQDLAFTGPDEINSTQLEPGVDPIEEAQRRGSILLVIRLGNMDHEAPNTPALTAPGPQLAMPQQAMPQQPQGMLPPGTQVPYMQPAMPQMPGMIPPGLPQGNGVAPLPQQPGAANQQTSYRPNPGQLQLTSSQQMGNGQPLPPPGYRPASNGNVGYGRLPFLPGTGSHGADCKT